MALDSTVEKLREIDYQRGLNEAVRILDRLIDEYAGGGMQQAVLVQARALIDEEIDGPRTKIASAPTTELARKYRLAVDALKAYDAAARGGDWATAIDSGKMVLSDLGEK